MKVKTKISECNKMYEMFTTKYVRFVNKKRTFLILINGNCQVCLSVFDLLTFQLLYARFEMTFKSIINNFSIYLIVNGFRFNLKKTKTKT